MTSGRRLYLDSKFGGIWPIIGEGRVVSVAWSVVILTGEQGKGNAKAQAAFFSAQNPIPWSDVTHIQGASSFLIRHL